MTFEISSKLVEFKTNEFKKEENYRNYIKRHLRDTILSIYLKKKLWQYVYELRPANTINGELSSSNLIIYCSPHNCQTKRERNTIRLNLILKKITFSRDFYTNLYYSLQNRHLLSQYKSANALLNFLYTC